MCGIFGIYNINSKQSFNKEKIKASIDVMRHRGPDAQEFEIFDDKAVLAHLRLSIIDLKAESNQPFQIDNKFWISYNGEIFNYLELKEELVSLGYSFKTESDTEVLLRSYQQWGSDCVKKFNGMWAFVIYNKSDNEFFCSRDRFGVKPFNYTVFNNQFLFSSEIKAIISFLPELKVPNYNVIANFCRTSIGAQTRETWFSNIFRLEPAHNMVVSQKGISLQRYWDYPRKVNNKINLSQATEQYKNIIKDAVKLRMRSDVPVGFTLSSGIDSTSLVCLLNSKGPENKNTYTASFSNVQYDKLEKQNFKNDIEIDEPSIVKRLTKEIDLNSNIVEIKYQDYLNELRKIVFHLESGHGSPAITPLFQILKEANKKVTVVLEGQGADELLGGYISNVYPIYIIKLLKDFKFSAAMLELKIFLKTYSLKSTIKLWVRKSNLGLLKKMFYKISGQEALYIGPIKNYQEIKDYPMEPHGFDCLLNEHLYKSHTGGLVNLLHYGDAISMAHSLESRLPFMDYRLVEFVFSLPYSFKISQGQGKYIHRQAMKQIVPDYILENKLKFGFETPLSHLFKQQGLVSCKSILFSEKCINRGLFCKKEMENFFDDHLSNKKNNSRILYRMLQVELWFQEFIDDK